MALLQGREAAAILTLNKTKRERRARLAVLPLAHTVQANAYILETSLFLTLVAVPVLGFGTFGFLSFPVTRTCVFEEAGSLPWDESS